MIAGPANSAFSMILVQPNAATSIHAHLRLSAFQSSALACKRRLGHEIGVVDEPVICRNSGV
jgi:hypothetical protein